MKYTCQKEAINEVIRNAKYYLGAKEGSLRHHQIIDSYNSVKPRPRSYVVTYTDSWCATFVTHVFDKSGLAYIISRECGCQEMINNMKKKGLIATNVSGMSVGDILFYDWNLDDHSEHVGIVVSINNNAKEAKIIEGNKNDAVEYRIIPISYKFIQCVGKPDYASAVSTEEIYKNVGWNLDSKGWWYAYANTKGSYYKNEIKEIDGKRYMFDSCGYVCDGSHSTFNEDGSLVEINGNIIGFSNKIDG